jgi:hypothetical protein
MAATPNITDAIANKYSSTLASGITDSDLTITVSDGSGLSATGGYVIIDEAISGSREIIYIESVSGNTLTVSSDGRGQQGTSAVAHNSGASITDILAQKHVNGINDQFKIEHNDSGVHTQIDSGIVSSGTDVTTSNKIIDEATYSAGTGVLDNDAALQGKEVGGTAREMIKMNTSDEVQVGNGTNLVVTKLQAGAGVYLSGNQSVPGGNVEAQIEFDSESWDDGGNFNTTTYGYTAPVAGRYLIVANPTLTDGSADKTGQVRAKVNGTETIRQQNDSVSVTLDWSTSRILTLAASDVLTFFILHNDTVNKTLVGGTTAGATFVEIEFLGRA